MNLSKITYRYSTRNDATYEVNQYALLEVNISPIQIFQKQYR